MIRIRSSLARQVGVGLVVYGLLLSAALFTHGLMVNEHAERMLWQAMLDTEMDIIFARLRDDPDHAWSNNGKLDLYRFDAGAQVPPEVSALPPGLHDEVRFNDNEWVVLVRDDSHQARHALALDIDGFEAAEWRLMRPVILFSILAMLLLSVAIFFGVRLLTGPLRNLATRIADLAPDRRGQRVELSRYASTELEVIAASLNDYLGRNDRFVERERAFIDSASHELRTPLTVIRGATQVARVIDGIPAAALSQLERIARTTAEMEEMVAMLLMLARDPRRIRDASERIRLDEVVSAVVEDHRALCEGKALRLVLGSLAPCIVIAPEAVVRVTVANLVRNAIEHSDQGDICIWLDASARVEIRDPGHGMTPEEISALYARIARGGDRGSGIGLALIARLSEHLGWPLDIQPGPDGQGTRVRLDLSGSLAP